MYKYHYNNMTVDNDDAGDATENDNRNVCVKVTKRRGLWHDLTGNTTHLTLRSFHVAMQNAGKGFTKKN